MQHARIGLLGWLITSVVVMGGCATTNDTAGAPVATPPSNATVVAAPPSATTAVDAATKTACTALDKAIESAETKTAKAEKIGPPAGHLAVSAEYSAVAAAFYAHMIGANAAVEGAANQVATALSDLSDAWAENPKTKPSKADLNTAIKNLTTACTPS